MYQGAQDARTSQPFSVGQPYSLLGSKDSIECFSMGREVPNPKELRQEYFESTGLPKELWENQISRGNKWPTYGDVDDKEKNC